MSALSADQTQGYNNKITPQSFAFALEEGSCQYPHDTGVDLCGVWQLGCYASEGKRDIDETYSFTGDTAISAEDEVRPEKEVKDVRGGDTLPVHLPTIAGKEERKNTHAIAPVARAPATPC